MHGTLPALADAASIVPSACGEDDSASSTCGGKRRVSAKFRGEGFAWFGQMVQKILRKPVADLAYLTGNNDSTCEKHAYGIVMPSATVLRDLLRGPIGDNALDYIMDGSDAKWWRLHLDNRRDGAIFRDAMERREQQLNLPIG